MFWRGAPGVVRDFRFGGAIGQAQRYRDASVGGRGGKQTGVSRWGTDQWRQATGTAEGQ